MTHEYKALLLLDISETEKLRNNLQAEIEAKREKLSPDNPWLVTRVRKLASYQERLSTLQRDLARVERFEAMNRFRMFSMTKAIAAEVITVTLNAVALVGIVGALACAILCGTY